MLGSVDRTVVYRSADDERLEHARLRLSGAGAVADGTIVGMLAGQPLRVRHEYTCDSRWHVRNVSVEVLRTGRALISLAADEDGTWRRVDGGILDVPLFNCFDIAVALTPLPAVLTLRRLALEPREVRIVNVASITIPELDVRLIEHRYTFLAVDAHTRRYRWENFDSGERSVITLDADGVVTAYDRCARLAGGSAQPRP
jgi:hypothetical protein